METHASDRLLSVDLFVK